MAFGVHVKLPSLSGALFFPGPSTTNATNIQANYIHIFNPNLVLELKTGYTRINIHTYPLNHGVDWASKLGLGNTYVTQDSIGLPFMWIITDPALMSETLY